MGCKRRRAKLSLLRLATRPGGGVAVDVRQRAPGRGAYVCARRACIENALRRGSLARALRCPSVATAVAPFVEQVLMELCAAQQGLLARASRDGRLRGDAVLDRGLQRRLARWAEQTATLSENS